MIRIKRKYLGSKISKGVQKYHLTHELSQAEIKLLMNVLSPVYFEEYTEKKKDKKIVTPKIDVIDSEQESGE